MIKRTVGRPTSEATVVIRVPLALREIVDEMVEHWRDRSAIARANAEVFSGHPRQRNTDAPKKGVKILKPADALETLRSLRREHIFADVLILDPWYEPAAGCTVSDHRDYYRQLIREGSKISASIFCWGTAAMLGPLVDSAPEEFIFRDWIVWSHANTPSVVRTNWRSTHQVCLHFSRPDAPSFPERFFSPKQIKLLEKSKLRFWPNPGNVVEAGLLVGAIGNTERVGHPAQKPIKVISALLKMACPAGGLVVDPFSGSGTTGVAAMQLGFRAILCDISPRFTAMARKRIRLLKASI